MRAKVDHVTDCVFLPAHAITRAGYTQFLRWSGWRRKLSLRREFSPASSQHLPRCRWGGAVAVLADGHSGLQRALLSVSSAQKCSGDGRLATPLGVSRAARSAVPCRSSVPGHRASRSKYTRGQSQETGSLSKSSGGVGALAKRVLLGPAWADSGS